MIRLEIKNYNVALTEKQQKISTLSSGKIDKYKCLTCEEILPSYQRKVIEQAKFTYSTLGKFFGKTNKNDWRSRRKKKKRYLKRLIMSSGEKDSLLLFKQKEIFDELVNKWKFEIDKFCEQINFNNSTYHYKGKSTPKYFICFKGPLIIYNNLKNGWINLQKEENIAEEFQSEIGGKLKGNLDHKTEAQVSATKI